MLRRLLEEWLPGLPLLCIPGNHDVPRSLRETFPESVNLTPVYFLTHVISFVFFSPFRARVVRAQVAADAPEGAVCFAERLGDWLVVGMDTWSEDEGAPVTQRFASQKFTRHVVALTDCCWRDRVC